jgi:two-component system, cell cycle response regulator DivK
VTREVRELILIVEDNERNLRLVRDLLQASGFATIEAENARTGLALAAARKPALILMDIQLPDLDGITALGRLRGHGETASTVVVALTAFAMNSDRQRFLDAGFDDYVEKPIDVKTFPAHVRELLRRRVPDVPV